MRNAIARLAFWPICAALSILVSVAVGPAAAAPRVPPWSSGTVWGPVEYDPRLMVASGRGDTVVFEADTLARDLLLVEPMDEIGGGQPVKQPDHWSLFFYIHSSAWVTTGVCTSCAEDSAVDWPMVERDLHASAAGPKGWIPLGRFDRVYWSRSECCSALVGDTSRYTVYWVAYGSGPAQVEEQYERDVTLKPEARLIGAAIVDLAQRRVIAVRSASSVPPKAENRAR